MNPYESNHPDWDEGITRPIRSEMFAFGLAMFLIGTLAGFVFGAFAWTGGFTSFVLGAFASGEFKWL